MFTKDVFITDRMKPASPSLIGAPSIPAGVTITSTTLYLTMKNDMSENSRTLRGRNKTQFLAIGSITLIGTCCMAMLAFWIALQVDLTTCYQRLAKRFNTAPTFGAVEGVIMDRVQNNITLGMSHEEVIAEFAKIAPPSIVDKWSFPDGEITEFVNLNTCFFSQNDIEFMTTYSSDGKLNFVKRYVDD